MEWNKENEAVAIRIDVDNGQEGFAQTICALLKESTGEPSSQEVEIQVEGGEDDDDDGDDVEEEEDDQEEVAIIVEEITKNLDRFRRNSRKEDGPTIVIPRVPEQLRKRDENAYEPSVVSIGPYHRTKTELQPMQMDKWHCLQRILDGNEYAGLNVYIHEIRALEGKARACYPEDIELTESEFVKMLLLDGCFIVGIFLPAKDEKDRFFPAAWNTSQVLRDLLILENQIPFFILQSIYDLATPTAQAQAQAQHPSSFTETAIKVLHQLSPNIALHEARTRMPPPPVAEIHHLLHLYHKLTLWSPNSESENTSQLCFRFPTSISCINIDGYLNIFSSTPKPEKRVKSIPSATELNEAGVKLKVKLSAESILAVRFSSDGVMEIPQLFIDHLTNSHF